MNIKTIYFLILIFLVNIIHTVNAQGTIWGMANLNLGILRPNYSAAGLARSFEVADNDSLHLNYQNFSTWSNITYTTYEVDGMYTASFSKDALGTDYFRDGGGFQGGFLALPLMPKKLVVGFGVQPVISMEETVRDTTTSYAKKYVVLKGSISRVTANISYKPFKRLGIGIGYEFNFGKIEDRYIMEMKEEDIQLDFSYEYRFSGHGLVLSAFFEPFDFITIGGLYRTPVNLNNQIYGFTNVSDVDAKIVKQVTIPSQLNLGALISLSDRIKIGGDLLYQDWVKGYKLENQAYLPYQNEYIRLGAGLEIKESQKRFTNFFNTLNYRAGAFYGTQKQTSLGNSVLEYGISAGFSVPLQRFVSRVDFSGIVGRRGSLDNNYFEENFFQFGISIVTNERWFMNIEE